MSYGSHVQGIIDSVVTVVKTATSLGNRVYPDYIIEIDTFPAAMVRIQGDRQTARGPRVTQHETSIKIEVVMLGQGTEAMQDLLIGYVGEVIDKLEVTPRTLSNAAINNVEVDGVEYSISPRDQAISYYAHIAFRVISIRNV